MIAPQCFIIPLVLIAIALDLYFIRRRHGVQLFYFKKKLPVPVRTHPQVTEISLTPAQTIHTDTPAITSEVKSQVSVRNLATWLFIGAISVYLLTRLIGLDRFPIYFFTDEAIQSLSMYDLINNGYRSPNDELFPTYFRNGEYYNIGLSVYLQWLPVLLFGKSAVATRAASVLVTLIAAFAVSITLRDVFKIKYWWTGTLFLSITPSWFLHSRTAFETAEFVAFYAGALCAYLLYRYKSPRYLYPAVFLGALAFYTYGAAQLIVPLTAAGLLISDWRYHWENRRTAMISLGLVVLLAIPYIRFRLNDPDAPLAHLHMMFSYLTEDAPLGYKVWRYVSEYWVGLSPWYWYIPNVRDLPRHLMKDYGNIMLATLPLALLGLSQILRNLRSSAHRAILIAILVSPTAAALVQTSITRALTFVVLAAILAALGLEQMLQWLEDPKKHLNELSQRTGPNLKRVILALFILGLGILCARLGKEFLDRLTAVSFAMLLALQVSGAFEHAARSLTSQDGSRRTESRPSLHIFLALATFAVLSAANLNMMNDALRNGPLWFRDYGLGGMQYGAFQMFDLLNRYVEEHPGTKIIFSPDWANGADVVARFFLDDPFIIQIGSVRGHVLQKLPLDENTLFVMTPDEYNLITEIDKFEEIKVVDTVPYPDGNPGFYFVNLTYVDNIDEMFAAEKAARQALQEGAFVIDGEPVNVRYSFLDTDYQEQSMALLFDGDPYTLTKTYEANPFVIELAFPEPRILNGFSIIIGSANVEIKLLCYNKAGAEPTIYTFSGQGSVDDMELSFDLPKPTEVENLRMEVRDTVAPAESKVHIWELMLR